jgi:hypothetical protein
MRQAMTLLGLSLLILTAFPERASAGSACSSSVVKLYAEDGTSQCVGVTETASSSFGASISPYGNGQASMQIRAGTFAGLATIGGENIGPTAVTFYAAATGEVVDSLRASGGAGATPPLTLVVPLHVTGAYDASFVAPVGVGFALPFVANSFSFTCSGFVGAAGGDCGHDSIGSSLAAMAAPEPVDQTWLLQIPIAIGAETFLDVKFILSAQMTPPGPVGITCEPSTDVGCHDAGDAVFDLSHTGVFEPATIVDADGKTVDDVTLESDSGFDYLRGVPEPDAASLGVAAIVAIAMLGRRSGGARSRSLAASERFAGRRVESRSVRLDRPAARSLTSC